MKLIIFTIIGVLALTSSYFFYGLTAASNDPVVFPISIKSGAGFRDIATDLEGRMIIKSATSFKLYALLAGAAHRLKPGEYLLSSSWSAPKLIQKLVEGPVEDIAVTIVEGETVKDINKKLGEVDLNKTILKLKDFEFFRYFQHVLYSSLRLNFSLFFDIH